MEFLIQEQVSGHVHVTIRGALDATTAGVMRERLDTIVESRPSSVTIDLSATPWIDSSGLGGIVALFRRVRAYGGTFRVEGAQGQPKGVFEVLRLDRAFC